MSASWFLCLSVPVPIVDSILSHDELQASNAGLETRGSLQFYICAHSVIYIVTLNTV